MRIVAIAAALTTALISLPLYAQMDVDQADSLNFEAFHKDKKEAVKVWKDDKTKKDETVKAYDAQETATPATAASSAVATTPVAASNVASTPVKGDIKPGQRYELRERYALGRSAKTPYSAFYVIEALHQQAVKLCPRGWKKFGERVEPVESDFFQYYEIECL